MYQLLVKILINRSFQEAFRVKMQKRERVFSFKKYSREESFFQSLRIGKEGRNNVFSLSYWE